MVSYAGSGPERVGYPSDDDTDSRSHDRGMTKRKPLQWYGDEGGKLGWPACVECMEKMQTPFLVEACASVGIEHGKSTGLMMKEFLDGYHARRHQDE